MAGVRVFLTADGSSLAVERGGSVLGEGRVARTTSGWDLTVTPDRTATADPEAVAVLLAELVATADRAGGGAVRWAVTDPSDAHDQVARGGGLPARRDLLQLRRPLPVDEGARAGSPTIAVRPFRPGIDDAAWLEVNNLAFADHPDQAGRTPADLADTVAQPWFDPEGFLLLDADGDRAGRLDGFCWTKVHTDHDPPLGEIFVIGVDPSAGGRGLGRALTLAGLDHLHRQGLEVGMLYVDVDNAPAMALYRRLGFTPHHLDRLYERTAQGRPEPRSRP